MLWTPVILNQAVLVTLAIAAADRHGLPAALVCGVCEEESGKRDSSTGGRESWNPYAVRFEPAFLLRYVKPTNPAAPSTSEITKATSYGLMQIMGLTAIEFGFAGRFLTELFEPSAALEFGCRKLRHAMDQAVNDMSHALLIYNGGADAEYPTRVLPRVAKYSA